jgi:hypothetical protein
LYNTLKQIHHEDCHYFMRRFVPSSLRGAAKARDFGLLYPGLIYLIGFLLLTSCLPAEPIPPTETPLPSDTPLPSPTIVWFPPSATPTLKAFPTYTPTPEMSPGIGPVFFKDDFTSDSAWDTAASGQGSTAISRNRLSMAAESGIYLVSMNREVTLGDFYAEITARPSLCRGDDSYGIIIRSSGSSFYRFTLNCNSMISAERIQSNVRLLMQEPTLSGDAPPGAPGEVHIGVWAAGSEMRLFLNDRFQFDISDHSSPIGAFGVFVRSAGDTPVSVTFSDLTVYDVDYVPPTRTPIP